MVFDLRAVAEEILIAKITIFIFLRGAAGSETAPKTSPTYFALHCACGDIGDAREEVANLQVLLAYICI